jgi:hypothetical protein
MAFEFLIDAKSLVARLERMPDKVREALKRDLKPAAEEGAAQVRAAAAAHIRFLGKKPGQYLASTYGGVFDKENRVGGFIRSGNALAHLLEYGTQERYRKSLRSVDDVLNHVRSGYTGAMPAFPVFGPVLEAKSEEWRDLIETSVRNALAKP